METNGCREMDEEKSFEREVDGERLKERNGWREVCEEKSMEKDEWMDGERSMERDG
jgi:hypothetical protein